MSYSNPDRSARDSRQSSWEYDSREYSGRKYDGNVAELHCELCGRSVAALTAHHLIPRQKTKRKNQDPGPTIQICSACHRQIHAFYDNTYLARELNTLDKLRQDPKMQKFIAWVQKQDPGKRVQVDRR